MKLSAKVYKTPSCASFVVVEDADASFAATSVQFIGTHSDYLADVFSHMVNTVGIPEDQKPSFIKKLFNKR